MKARRWSPRQTAVPVLSELGIDTIEPHEADDFSVYTRLNQILYRCGVTFFDSLNLPSNMPRHL